VNGLRIKYLDGFGGGVVDEQEKLGSHDSCNHSYWRRKLVEEFIDLMDVEK